MGLDSNPILGGNKQLLLLASALPDERFALMGDDSGMASSSAYLPLSADPRLSPVFLPTVLNPFNGVLRTSPGLLSGTISTCLAASEEWLRYDGRGKVAGLYDPFMGESKTAAADGVGWVFRCAGGRGGGRKLSSSSSSSA